MIQENRMTQLKKDMERITAWSIATPVLAGWALVSFLPFFNLFAETRTALSIALDVVFFGSGFTAMLFLFLAARWAAAGRDSLQQVTGVARGKGLKIAAYAGVWLVLYSAYRYFI